MTHQPFRDWLAAEDLTLNPGERAALHDHLAGCPECRAVREGIVFLDRLLARPLVLPAPTGFTARFQGRLASRQPRPRWILGGAVLGLGATGALATVVAALAPLLSNLLAVSARPGLAAGSLLGAQAAGRVLFAIVEAFFTALRALAVYGGSQPAVAAFAVAALGALAAWVLVMRRLELHGGLIR